MENPIILIPATVGLTFILLGLVLLKFPPRKINWIYGYRTPGSMKTQERWDFAQKYSAKEMIKSGGLLLLTATIGLFYKPEDKMATIIGIGILIFSTLLLLVRVEKAIWNRFSKSGK